MPAPSGNSNARKEEEAKASSFLYVRATPGNKAAWAAAAQRRGQKLAQWVTERLNRAAKA